YDAPPTIFVQQDNAKSHVAPDDVSVVSACMSGGWDIMVLNQPAQSPDMNVLDLGLFNSIQALQQRMECSSIEDLVCAVEQSFEDLAPSTLDKTFEILLRVFQACLDVEGNNTYDMPRSKRQKQAECDDSIVLDMLKLRLEEEDRLDELCDLVNGLSAL
ncbi:hypothetical protein DYB32_010746, partial [Aphanomyces invadans]